MKNWTLNIFKYLKDTAFFEAVLTFLILFSVLFFVHNNVNASSDDSSLDINKFPISVDEYNNLSKQFFSNSSSWFDDPEGAFNICKSQITTYNVDDYPYVYYELSDGFIMFYCTKEPLVYANMNGSSTLSTPSSVYLGDSFSPYIQAGNQFLRFDLWNNGGIYTLQSGVFETYYVWYPMRFLSLNSPIYFASGDAFVIPSTPAIPLASLSIGDLEFKGHSDGFSNDLFDSIANNTYSVFGNTYHDLYSMHDILNATDVMTGIRMLLENIWNSILNLGVLLRNILVAIMWFFDDILTWIRNFWENLVLVLTRVINLLVGTFDKDDSTPDFFTWFDQALQRFYNSLIELPVFSFFEQIKEFGEDLDHRFDFLLFLRRLVIPDDLDPIKERFLSEIESEKAYSSGTALMFINEFESFYNNFSGGVVPTFTISSFNFMGQVIPEIVISFAFLEPYLPLVHGSITVFMYISFIIMFVKELPSIIRGVGSSSSHVLSYKGEEERSYFDYLLRL